jgi:hypothetical protein
VAEYLRFVKEFGDLEYAWVVVDSQGTDGVRRMGEAQRAVDELPREVRAKLRVAVEELPEDHELKSAALYLRGGGDAAAAAEVYATLAEITQVYSAEGVVLPGTNVHDVDVSAAPCDF